MTTIGVLSDTHIRPGSKRQIPAQVWEYFQGVDLILHGGDVNTLSVLLELEHIAPTFAVHGNNDDAEAMRTLPTSRRIEVENTVIGLVQGDQPARGVIVRNSGYEGNGYAAAHAISHFEHDGDIGCIVFGHSHRTLCTRHALNGHKVLLLNPGSPTDKRYGPHHACAILRVDGDSIEAELKTW
ncbi:MAG: uncharacterized protein JWN98_61 [Abditibacteriota bacterium]|nr:uncharacterized protein [Abditibacteriota bacterium]